MYYQFSLRNTFILALIVLFSTICLLPMNLSAGSSDHDNLYIHDVSAQTSLGLLYVKQQVKTGAYANIWNSSDIAVRYYYSASASVWRQRGLPKQQSDADKGWVQPGSWISFLPLFTFDMSDAQDGKYTATGDVEVGLKFDFDGDGVWDDGATVASSAYLKFEIK